MLLFGIACLSTGGAIYYSYKELKAKRKQQQIYQYIHYLSTDLNSNRAVNDAMLIGSAATAMTIFSVYDAISEHEAVLDVMEYRYPNELMDATPLEWLTKVEEIYSGGDAALNGFINGYAGQQAENITLEHFRSMGAEASLFEQLNHPNDDISVTMDGETIHYSVKSYADVSSFNAAVESHPESTHYVVNQELYADLQQRGLIESYEAKGITIIEGQYSNAALREEATAAFEHIHQAADVADYIPFVGLVMYGVRSGMNVYDYKKGKQSGHELKVNLVSDAGKIGVASGAGFGGAKLGGLIGTALMPGIGTIVGGGIGAVIGVFSGSKVMDYLKSKWKWGKIVDAQEELGVWFKTQLSNNHYAHYTNQLYPYQNVKQIGEKDQHLSLRYQDAIDIYSSKPVTLAAVLHHMYADYVEHMRKSMEQASVAFKDKLIQISSKVAADQSKDSAKAKNAYLGEIVINNAELLLLPHEQHKYEPIIEQYYVEKEKYPNHPYQYSVNTEQIVEQVKIEALQEQLQKKSYYSFIQQSAGQHKNKIIIFTIIAILSFFIYF